jgi:hypothetical protein
MAGKNCPGLLPSVLPSHSLLNPFKIGFGPEIAFVYRASDSKYYAFEQM